jgi:hypothetical protein
MKTTLSSIAAAVAFASLFAAGAHAADTADSVQIKARAGYHLTPKEFRDYQSAYALSNGDTVKFSQRMNRYFTSVEGESAIEIFAVAPDAFVTGNGASIKFSNNGDELAISNYERLQVNAKLAANTIVTARR